MKGSPAEDLVRPTRGFAAAVGGQTALAKDWMAAEGAVVLELADLDQQHLPI